MVGSGDGGVFCLLLPEINVHSSGAFGRQIQLSPLFSPTPVFPLAQLAPPSPPSLVVVVVGNSGATNLVRERGRDALRAAAQGKVGREGRDPHFPPPPPQREEGRRKLCARKEEKGGNSFHSPLGDFAR